MAVLARLYDFTPGMLIQSSQVDAEFQQLIDLLAGTSTSKDALIKYTHATDAPLRIDQLGAGLLAEWKLSGTQKARINNAGGFQTVHQFISTLSTGTKPIDVTSTTLCTNLNADLLDGIDGGSFLRSDAADVMSASDGTSLLDINQTGAGAITRFQQGGSTKVTIANSGQIQSAVSTGTAPFSVASTTAVSNLNADQVDSLHASSFVRTDSASEQGMIGDLRLTKSNGAVILNNSGGTRIAGLFQSGDGFSLSNFVGGTGLLSFDLTTDVGTFVQIPVLPASSPTTDNQATRKKYVDDLIATCLKNNAAGTLSASDATSLLDINQTGAGAITRFRQGGSNKVVIANDGQIQSSVAGGTAPFTVASTTLVSNLNADLLDGLNSSVFVRNDTAGQTITGDLTISGATPTLNFTDTTSGDDDFRIFADGDVLTLEIQGSTDIATFRSSGSTFALPVTFSDDVVITDDHLQINTSAGLNANNRLTVNHNESPQTDAAVSLRSGATNVTPLDLVTEASASNSAFRIWEDNDATVRTRFSSDGKIETRAGNGSTPSTGFVTLGGLYYRDFTSLGHDGTGTDTLHSKTLEANLWGEDGDTLHVVFCGSFAANANSKSILARVAGTQVAGGTAAYNGAGWRLDLWITRIDSDSVRVSGLCNGGIINPVTDYTQIDGLNFASTITVDCQAIATAANDVVYRFSTMYKYSNQS